MAKQSINIGAEPNDGSGDPLRTAFDKINDNFDEVYSSYLIEGPIYVGNSSVNSSVNSTFFSATSNNTSFVGSVSAANVVSNAQLSANLASYQTTAGLPSNVATLTANNTSFVGSISAANVVSNAQLQANLSLYQTSDGLSANVARLTANNTSFVGSISAANVVSNAQLQANLTPYVNTSANFSINGVLTFNSVTVTNTSGIFTTQTVNAATLSTSGFSANATVANAVSYRIGSTFVANTLGVYHTGVVNAAAHTIGSSFIANTIGLFSTSNVGIGAGITSPITNLQVNGSIQSANIIVKNITQNYTLSANDSGTTITVSNTSAVLITVPASLPVGFRCLAMELDTGTVEIQGASGVTVNSRTGSNILTSRWGSISMFVYAANSVIVDGSI
jgi:hypothetical protein